MSKISPSCSSQHVVINVAIDLKPSGMFVVSKMIDLSSSNKFRAPKQIWNSDFSHLPKHGLENDLIVPEMNELPYYIFKTVFSEGKYDLT